MVYVYIVSILKSNQNEQFFLDLQQLKKESLVQNSNGKIFLKLLFNFNIFVTTMFILKEVCYCVHIV